MPPSTGPLAHESETSSGEASEFEMARASLPGLQFIQAPLMTEANSTGCPSEGSKHANERGETSCQGRRYP